MAQVQTTGVDLSKKNWVGKPKILGAQKVVKSNKYMDVSQLLEGHVPGLHPQSLRLWCKLFTMAFRQVQKLVWLKWLKLLGLFLLLAEAVLNRALFKICAASAAEYFPLKRRFNRSVNERCFARNCHEISISIVYCCNISNIIQIIQIT